jgi:hypothetical protein
VSIGWWLQILGHLTQERRLIFHKTQHLVASITNPSAEMTMLMTVIKDDATIAIA